MISPREPTRTLVQWAIIGVALEVATWFLVPPLGATFPIALASAAFALGWLDSNFKKWPPWLIVMLGSTATLVSAFEFGVARAIPVAAACYMCGGVSFLVGGVLRVRRKRQLKYGAPPRFTSAPP